jgi:hypothetical protein
MLSGPTFDALRTRFDKHRGAILAAVEARSKERLRYLLNTIELRKRKEIDDVRQVLEDLERTLKFELASDQVPRQLSLFTDEQRLQMRRDKVVLEGRLARIPEERKQEVLAIEDRHSGATDHTFPVAVVLLVPSSFAASGLHG